MCVHSVVVAGAWRRRGLGVRLLRAYVTKVEQLAPSTPLRAFLLLCKLHLVGFYRRAGFSLIGLSPVEHGRDPWYTMRRPAAAGPGPRVLHIDAFTSTPFAGNPACCVIIMSSQWPADEWLRSVAVERNLAETAFVLVDGKKHDKVAATKELPLRWLTRGGMEVDLCGHATLAAAHALWSEGRVPKNEPCVFITRSGRLVARRRDHHPAQLVVLDFPTQMERTDQALPTFDLLATALHVDATDLLHVGSNGVDVLVELTPERFSNLLPDIEALSAVEARGVIVTCKGGTEGVAFSSRFFAPRICIPEDSVTGSTHTYLAPYWTERLGLPSGSELRARQASARGGELLVSVVDGGRRVTIAGSARTVSTSTLLHPIPEYVVPPFDPQENTSNPPSPLDSPRLRHLSSEDVTSTVMPDLAV